MNNSLVENMTKIKDEYYTSSGKNLFLKKKQKQQIAEAINSKYSLDDLIENTVYVVKNTNCIYIDYSVFKMYSVPSNYQDIIDRCIEIIIMTINKYGSFQLHINLRSFNITALEMYKSVFQLYNSSCITQGLLYDSKNVEKITIYNTPSVINTLSMIIVRYTDRSIKNKIIYHSSDVSQFHLDNLLN